MCAAVLYLLYVWADAYNIIIGHAVGSPGQVKYVFGGLNSNKNNYPSMLMNR